MQKYCKLIAYAHYEREIVIKTGQLNDGRNNLIGKI